MTIYGDSLMRHVLEAERRSLIEQAAGTATMNMGRPNTLQYHKDSGCPCRRKKEKGCQGGKCECNRDAFISGGILLVASCQWRPLWDIQASGHYGPYDQRLWDPTRTVAT